MSRRKREIDIRIEAFKASLKEDKSDDECKHAEFIAYIETLTPLEAAHAISAFSWDYVLSMAIASEI